MSRVVLFMSTFRHAHDALPTLTGYGSLEESFVSPGLAQYAYRLN